MDNLMAELLPVLTSAVVAIVTALIGFMVKAATTYINNKKEQVSQQIGIDKFNYMLKVAETVYYMVEQEFRNAEEDKDYVNRAKKSTFDEMMLSTFPNLSPEVIRTLREAVIGKVKKSLVEAKLFEPVTEEVLDTTEFDDDE